MRTLRLSTFIRPGLLAVTFAAVPSRAFAHAFGVRYDLPLPFSFYLIAAAAAVVLSFVVMALVARKDAERWALRLPILAIGQGRVWVGILRTLIGSFGCFVLLLVVTAGFLGVQSPQENIGPLTVWVLWWVGFVLFTALIGNLWDLLDPWRAVAQSWSRIRGTAARWPERRPSSWFAPLLLLIFIGFELVGTLGESPRGLANLVLFYSLLTWAGMTLYGIEGWRRAADPFTRVFGLLGRFAPLAPERLDGGRALVVRPPGAGLRGDPPEDLGQLAFVVLLLASVTFDGFSETPLWAGVLDWIAADTTLRPLLLWLRGLGVDLLAFLRALGLVAAPLVVAAVFAFFSLLMSRLGGAGSTGEVMRRFALSLLPIAIAYHLSHYCSYLLFAGQLAIPLASDPFGWGWNLFGTANYVVDIGIIGAKAVWYISIVAVVTGHVISVVLAHLEALDYFPTRRGALLSQLPMLVLMVLFTMASLWILAQPVVEPAV